LPRGLSTKEGAIITIAEIEDEVGVEIEMMAGEIPEVGAARTGEITREGASETKRGDGTTTTNDDPMKTVMVLGKTGIKDTTIGETTETAIGMEEALTTTDSKVTNVETEINV